MSARILTCTDEEYFADPCDVPSLSQSIATTLVKQSPAHAYIQHPKLGKTPGLEEEDTKAMSVGRLLHKLVLGKGPQIAVVEAKDWRTNVAKAQRDAAKAAGLQPMLREQYDTTVATAEAMRNALAQRNIQLSGESEFALEWDEQGANGPVRCRGKMDHVILDRGVIYDIKKISSAHPKTCTKHMIEYGYDIQRAAYTSAIEKLRPELTGKVEFIFLFIEDGPPYAITPAEADGAMREHGSSRWRRAVHLWERCLSTNTWPGYTDGIVQLSPPPWAMTEELGTGDW